MLQRVLTAMSHVYFAGWAGLRSGPNIAVEPTPYRAKHSSISLVTKACDRLPCFCLIKTRVVEIELGRITLRLTALP
jgi:hypothetical protein